MTSSYNLTNVEKLKGQFYTKEWFGIPWDLSSTLQQVSTRKTGMFLVCLFFHENALPFVNVC